jgi:hypothetical protein
MNADESFSRGAGQVVDRPVMNEQTVIRPECEFQLLFRATSDREHSEELFRIGRMNVANVSVKCGLQRLLETVAIRLMEGLDKVMSQTERSLKSCICAG